MSTPTMSPRFASEVEHALESLPNAALPTASASSLRVRTAVVTAVVAAAVIVVTVLAIGLAPHRAGPAAPTTVPASSGVATCTAAEVGAFGCDLFLLKSAKSDFVEFEAWFDVMDGRPRFIVGESERLRILPLTLTSSGAMAGPVAGWPQLQRVCFPDSECEFDQTIEQIFTSGARLTISGKTLHLSGSSTTLAATSTGREHRYPQLGRVVAGDHVLLTYHANGAQMAAAGGGRVTYNAAGCLTDGLRVIVLPDTTVLHPDGSIDIDGNHIPIGGTMHLGGGEGSVPADQRCGTGDYFYGYGA